MDRREIFNILFKGNSVNEPIVLEPDPVLETPVYLKTDQTIKAFKEWRDLPGHGTLNLDLSTEYAFTIILDLITVIHPVNLTLGIKNGKPRTIKIGLNQEGHLFINGQVDERIIGSEKRCEGLQLVLTVNPLEHGMSFAKLKIMDRAGLTLSILKSKQYTTADWAGEMALTELQFNFLRIEGLHTIEI